jgi:flagellar biosynthetic protein FliS
MNQREGSMTAHSGYSTYTSNSAQHASPGIQVAMLLAMAARHMEVARDAMRVSNIESRYLATEKCAAIISGLRSCLDRATPEARQMSDMLDSYYARLLTFLTQINIKNDLPLCESVIESLRAMSSTWREVQARADAEAQSSLVPSKTGTSDTGSATSGGGFSAVSA